MNGPFEGEFGKGLGASRKKETRVEIEIPRRSIYIMSGPSRTDWKHEISKIADTSPPSPEWNPRGFRRSLNLRTAKWYSDAVLQLRLQNAQTNEDDPAVAQLIKRIKAQRKFKTIEGALRCWFPRGKKYQDNLAQEFAKEIEGSELTSLKFTPQELRGGGEFQGAGQHLGGASGTSMSAPSGKRTIDLDEMRKARVRRFAATAPATESQEVIIIDKATEEVITIDD